MPAELLVDHDHPRGPSKYLRPAPLHSTPLGLRGTRECAMRVSNDERAEAEAEGEGAAMFTLSCSTTTQLVRPCPCRACATRCLSTWPFASRLDVSGLRDEKLSK